MYHLTEAYLMTALICLLAAFFGALAFAISVGSGPGARMYGSDNRVDWYDYSMSVHRFAAWCATLFTVAITVGSTFSAVPMVYTLLVVSLSGLMSVLYLLAWRTLPAIRQAETSDDPGRLSLNRRAAISLFTGGMLLTLSVIIALAYVLPGHFTYYPVEPTAVGSLFVQSV